MENLAKEFGKAGVSFVKVKLKDLKGNPFRDFKLDPLDEKKLAEIEASIRSTGLWENIIGREVDGEVQIAYGHHRLAAALNVLGPNYEYNIGLRDLSDDQMLIMMAAENSDDWAESIRHVQMSLTKARDRIESAILGSADWDDFKQEYGNCPYMMRSVTAKAYKHLVTSFETAANKTDNKRNNKPIEEIGPGHRLVCDYLGWERRGFTVWPLIGFGEMQKVVSRRRAAEAKQEIEERPDLHEDVKAFHKDTIHKDEADDLWDGEIAGLFESSTQVKAFRKFTLDNGEFIDEHVGDSSDLWNIAVDLVEQKGRSGVVPQIFDRTKIRAWLRENYPTASQASYDDKRAALDALAGATIELRDTGTKAHRRLAEHRVALSDFIRAVEKYQAQENAESQLAMAEVKEEILKTLDRWHEYGLLNDYFKRYGMTIPKKKSFVKSAPVLKAVN